MLKNFFKYLSPADVVTQSFLAVLTFIFIIFNVKIELWFLYIPLNILLICSIWFLVIKYERKVIESKLEEKDAGRFLKILRYWYGVAAILIIFKEVYFIIYYLKPPDIDLALIKADFIIFGLNPTQWAYKFKNPVITEFLQLVYVYYYPMIVVIGLQLYLKHRYKEFKFTIFIVFFSFYFSYLLYFFFPANGPRFHLHDFYAITTELPGVFLTEHIRAFLNFGESIPPGVMNPQDYVQRDAMPSLHTITAFLIMYISWKIRSKSLYFYLPYFFCMVAATIYLRYHYVVDIFAGLVVCAVTILVSNVVYRNKPISGS